MPSCGCVQICCSDGVTASVILWIITFFQASGKGSVQMLQMHGLTHDCIHNQMGDPKVPIIDTLV